MSADSVKSQFLNAVNAASQSHALLILEINKPMPDMDSLCEYADSLRDSVMVMRLLDGLLKQQAEDDALAVPYVRN